MSQEIQSPLQSIVQRLAATNIEGPASRIDQRYKLASEELVVLCDCSGSMADTIGSQDISKYEHLKIALDDVMQRWPKIRLISFNGDVALVRSPKHLPRPLGNTDLTGALRLAQGFKPRKTIVISDGLPDDEPSAFLAAQMLTGAIDTIYCGPDSHPAIAFLRSLSRESGGVSAEWDGGRPEIAATIRGLLAAPLL